jgi:hypothetical protein
VNADPNYGSAWFHCRELPFDIPGNILATAQRMIRADIESVRLLYARAILLFLRRQCDEHCALRASLGDSVVQDLNEDFFFCDQMLLLPAKPMSAASKSTSSEGGLHGPILLEIEDTLISPQDFVTGIVELNRTMFGLHNSEELRRKYLFGIDQIVS